MLRALANATADLFLPGVLGRVGAAAALGAALFVAAWFGLDALVGWWVGSDGALPAALSWLGATATLVLAWFLFPAVASALLSPFLDGTAAAVEQAHHPGLGPAPGLPWAQALAAALRFLVLCLVVNVALLVLLLAPPVYAVAWPLANGWLLGREFFEVVALRRLDPAAAHALRHAHRLELLVLGVVIALVYAVPLLNLVAPVWATAVMVHRFAAWRSRQ